MTTHGPLNCAACAARTAEAWIKYARAVTKREHLLGPGR